MKQLFAFAPLGRYTNLWLLILRVLAAGFMLFAHGLSKWERLNSGEEIKFADPFGLGPTASLTLTVFAEVVCAILIILGLFTRWATIPLIITMVVAAFVANADQPFQKMELALVYLLLYVTIFVFGAGRYSLDRMISERRSI